VRVYTEIVDNPKLRCLPETLQLMFLWCLCLHKRGRLAGKSAKEIGYSLRLRTALVEERLTALRKANLLLSDNTPKGWSDYQYESDSSAARVQKHRRKHRNDVTGNAGETLQVTPVERCGNGAEQNRTEQSRAETRAREEKMASAGAVVRACEVALGRLLECGPGWERLTLEHLVEMVRQFPKADLTRVVNRVRADWMNQPISPGKTAPMLVRIALGYDEVDGGKIARKIAAPGGPAVGSVEHVEMLRMKRIGGG
jgi:hypothetical protein